MPFARIRTQLEQLRQQALFRSHRVIESAPGNQIAVAGQRYLNFSGNDYLGLSQHPDIKKAFQVGIEEYGCSSTASAVVVGNQKPHQQLIERFCEWTGREAGLLFNCGFSANQAVISALLTDKDCLVADKLSHASLIEAGVNSTAKMLRYSHNDMQHLQSRLQNQLSDNLLVATEGVFSMDGDTAPLADVVELCKKHHAWLLLDDAHGLGVLGEGGSGSLSEQKLNNDDCEILMSTFGKAMGVSGAIISAQQHIVEYLTNFCKAHVYSTAMPAAQAMAVDKAIQVVQMEDWRREQLNERIAQFRTGAESLGLHLMTSNTAIQPVIIGENQKALDISARLKEKGIWASAIRPPTVPKGTARLRIVVNAMHSQADIRQLLDALEVCCEQ